MESSLGLVAACLPAIYALIKIHLVKSLKHRSKTRTGSTSSENQIIPHYGRTAIIDSHALRDLDPSEQHHGQISVKKTINQREFLA